MSNRHKEHQLSFSKSAVNADVFPVVARLGNVVTFGKEAATSTAVPSPQKFEMGRCRLYTSYIVVARFPLPLGERNLGEELIFLQVVENLAIYWSEVKRKSNKTKHIQKNRS